MFLNSYRSKLFVYLIIVTNMIHCSNGQERRMQQQLPMMVRSRLPRDYGQILYGGFDFRGFNGVDPQMNRSPESQRWPNSYHFQTQRGNGYNYWFFNRFDK